MIHAKVVLPPTWLWENLQRLLRGFKDLVVGCQRFRFHLVIAGSEFVTIEPTLADTSYELLDVDCGIAALADYLKEIGRKFHIVFGTLNDRPFEEMLLPLLPFGHSFSWALFEGTRAFSSDQMKEMSARIRERYGVEGKILPVTQESWKDFLAHLPSDEAVLVTGSLCLVSQVRGFNKEISHA